MKPFALIIAAVLTGCAPPKHSTVAHSEAAAASEPSGFFVDPKFPHGEEVMVTMRRLFPNTKYIGMSDVSISEDATHDYAEFFVGRGIDYGFEGVYYRYFIFAKKKSEVWSKARVFDKGALGSDQFLGPIELLEAKGWEDGKMPNLK